MVKRSGVDLDAISDSRQLSARINVRMTPIAHKTTKSGKHFAVAFSHSRLPCRFLDIYHCLAEVGNLTPQGLVALRNSSDILRARSLWP